MNKCAESYNIYRQALLVILITKPVVLSMLYYPDNFRTVHHI